MSSTNQLPNPFKCNPNEKQQKPALNVNLNGTMNAPRSFPSFQSTNSPQSTSLNHHNQRKSIPYNNYRTNHHNNNNNNQNNGDNNNNFNRNYNRNKFNRNNINNNNNKERNFPSNRDHGNNFHEGRLNKQQFHNESNYKNETKPFNQSIRKEYPNNMIDNHPLDNNNDVAAEDDIEDAEFEIDYGNEVIICGIDNCEYEDTETNVMRHIQKNHFSGKFEKLQELQCTPADIENWKMQRRKMYPTLENIEKRQKMQAARLDRGERINEPTGRFGTKWDKNRCKASTVPQDDSTVEYRNKNVDNSNDNDESVNNTQKSNFRNSSTTNKRKSRTRNTKKPGNKNNIKKEMQIEDLMDEDNFNGNLKRFKGTSQLEDYHSKNTGLLLGYLGMYGSSSDLSESDNENELNDDDALQSITVNVKQTDQKEENHHSSDDDLPEEQPIQRKNDLLDFNKEDLTENLSNMETTTENTANCLDVVEDKVEKRIIRKKTTLSDLEKRYRSQNTLLEKLLAKEIRHERNVLLQCVHYVVKNNFFDKPLPGGMLANDSDASNTGKDTIKESQEEEPTL